MAKREREGFDRAARFRAVVARLGAILAAAAALAALVLLYRGFEQRLIEDPRFQLRPLDGDRASGRELRIEGIRHARRERIAEVFAEDAGRSLYRVPLAERRRRLLEVDWVREASVARLWPNRLEVRIEERRPAAFVRLEPRRPGALAHTALIDAEGVLLEIPAGSDYDLPVLAGVREDQPREARALRVRKMQRLLEEIGELGERVSEVDAGNPNNLRARVQAGGRLVEVWLGQERYKARLSRFLQYYPEVRRRYPEATRFDLRLDDRITVIDGVNP